MQARIAISGYAPLIWQRGLLRRLTSSRCTFLALRSCWLWAWSFDQALYFAGFGDTETRRLAARHEHTLASIMRKLVESPGVDPYPTAAEMAQMTEAEFDEA